MARSTRTQRVQRLNAAFDLMGQGKHLNEAVEALVERFGLSQRQAYRYVREARALSARLETRSPTIPITIKVPQAVAMELRAHARASGVTIGETVARAVTEYLRRSPRRG